MSLPLKMWFDPTVMPERRKPRNRMKRIAIDSQQQDERQIERWLELGEKVLRDEAVAPRSNPKRPTAA